MKSFIVAQVSKQKADHIKDRIKKTTVLSKYKIYKTSQQMQEVGGYDNSI